ncbi:AAA family ATPase [Nocardia canadensis]|uniref:AAA family ATPase n=1 Tax=Nocardia canadensis TaxID=3065238 RepID=UPI00292DAE9C|nr:AAA family ATPase [Nocardia canadensis]
MIDEPPPLKSMHSSFGPQTEVKIGEVIATAQRYGDSSIVALAGVPGTGKSYVGRIASQRLADAPERVLEVQFHPSSSYEEFVEGMRVEHDGRISPANGAFLEWNELAAANPDETWVVLIDEFSRADVSAVLGEVMTFVEDRSRTFTPTYSRRPVRIAENLRIIVTFNPTDRSALDIDNALLRRLRIVDFPPDETQLAEMLTGRLSVAALKRLTQLFPAVRAAHPELYEHQMPFGHGIFAEVNTEVPDLHDLWQSRIRHMLRRPLVAPHPLTNAIEAAYPWTDPKHQEHRGSAISAGNGTEASTIGDQSA